MTATRLKRKHRKNIARANNKQTIIKQLMLTPVLKNVDIEELKAKFPATSGAAGVASPVKAATTSVVDSAKDAAASVLDKVKGAATKVVDAVSHSEVVEKAKEVVDNIVEKVQDAAGGDQPTGADTAKDNAEAFDDAEAVTKPVNGDGQEGEHPKPEIAL